MQPLIIHEGTFSSRIGTLNKDHLRLLLPLVPVTGGGADRQDVLSVRSIWNRILEKATRVEMQALDRLDFHLEQHFKLRNGSSGEPGDCLIVLGLEEEPLEAALWSVCFERRRARLLQLRALLRAKLLRRLVAQCRSYRRLPLTGKRRRMRCETGSAAATARRLFPLGAPPLGA